MGGKLADRAETVPVGYEEDVYDEDDYEEEVSYPLSAREMKEQHNQRREAEAASKNQRNEEIFRAYGSILRKASRRRIHLISIRCMNMCLSLYILYRLTLYKPLRDRN